LGFDAREWISSVRDAARMLASRESLMEARREAAMSLGCHLRDVVVAFTPDSDKMRRVDDLVDSEDDHGASADAARTLSEAAAAFDGMRRVGYREARAADVMELSAVYGMSRRDIAGRLSMSVSTANRAYDYGLDWLDANGLAHAISGTGRAEL
jgi:hypothetical protein